VAQGHRLLACLGVGASRGSGAGGPWANVKTNRRPMTRRVSRRAH